MESTKIKDHLRHSYEIARESPDPSTQNGGFLLDENGTVLQETIAWNEFPKGVRSTPARWVAPEKYLYVEHAERNIIYKAAKHGISTDGKKMVVAWAPCTDCARAIIQAGITELITHRIAQERHWGESIQVADTLLEEAGVVLTVVSEPIGAVEVRRHGESFLP